MSVVTRNLRIFIMERKPKDIGEMSELAEQYFEVHGNTYIFANVGKHRKMGLYRENAIAIESEASDSLSWTPSIDQSEFSRKERNLHCDVRVT